MHTHCWFHNNANCKVGVRFTINVIAHAHNFGALFNRRMWAELVISNFWALFEKMSSSVPLSEVSFPAREASFKLHFVHEPSVIVCGCYLQKRRLTYLRRDGENKENQVPASAKPRKDESEGGHRKLGRLRQQKSSCKLALKIWYALLINL